MYTGQYPPPNALYIRAANFALKELTFSWSPVAPDCPLIHYNILASNCGSCPTTTNHTNITCTDVPINGSNCTFAVQTVVCGNLAGNASEPISITFYPQRAPRESLHPTENLSTHNSEHDLDTNVAPYTISIGLLTTALIICVVVSVVVIVIILTRNKITAAFAQSNREGSIIHAEPAHEDVTGPLPSVSTITTQENIAYGHVKTSTLK